MIPKFPHLIKSPCFTYFTKISLFHLFHLIFPYFTWIFIPKSKQYSHALQPHDIFSKPRTNPSSDAFLLWKPSAEISAPLSVLNNPTGRFWLHREGRVFFSLPSPQIFRKLIINFKRFRTLVALRGNSVRGQHNLRCGFPTCFSGKSNVYGGKLGDLKYGPVLFNGPTLILTVVLVFVANSEEVNFVTGIFHLS